MVSALSGMPFDDFRDLVRQMPGPDEESVQAVRTRNLALTKPVGSLGQLESLVEWLAAWQRRSPPMINRPQVAIFAGNHGVAARGISAWPSSVTQQMVDNFAAGGAAINQICLANNLALKVYDLALEYPTGDITVEAAMEEESCARTMAFGMESTADGIDLLCIGEMGIGNTTVASAIFAALYGGEPAEWIGPGTGVDEEGLARKEQAVAAALACHRGNLDDPLEVLRRVGGREIAAMVGAIIAARLNSIPVIVDGFVASSAAAIVHAMAPEAIDHCMFGHLSAEPAHRRALERMGRSPLLYLGMRLGEGTGAALAATIVRSAASMHMGMATFAQAGVAEKGG